MEQPSPPWSFHTCKSDIIRQDETKFKSEMFSCDLNTLELHNCEICEFVTDLKVMLSNHMWGFHEKRIDSTLENILGCSRCLNCGFVTYSVLVFLKHVRTCKSGGKKCYEYESPVGVKTLKCRYCVYGSIWEKNMRSHILNRHTDEKYVKWYECGQCSYRTKHKSYLKLHILWKHTDAKDINWFQCEQCPFKTKQNAILKNHILSKHSTSVDWFECEQCSFKAKLKTRLNKHIAVKHAKPEDINWIKCEHCPFRVKARQKWDLKKHVIAKHTNPEDIEWFKCDRCEFKAKRKGNLMVHLKRHALEKPVDPEDTSWFKCEQCSFKTKQKGNLRRHVLKKHANRNEKQGLKKIERCRFY